MNEITKVVLENEMDLILAHKQSMRLAELAGLSLAAQTTFATAVSEVSRSAIGAVNDASLTLYVSDKKERQKYLTAVLEDKRKKYVAVNDDGYKYAKRLVSYIETETDDNGNKISLNYRLAPVFRVDDILLEKWRINLNTDPAVSPYEEIKRKNRQLVELADKLRESEQQYKALTDSLPIMIFSTDLHGNITYANQWLHDYTGESTASLNNSGWEQVMHSEDLAIARHTFKQNLEDPNDLVGMERRLKEAGTGEYRWHKGVSIAIKAEDGSLMQWNTFMVDIHAQKLIEETLKDNIQLKAAQAELQEKVIQLNDSNRQLEQFAYVTSHDLQEPLRKISFYSDLLMKKYGSEMPEGAAVFFNNLISAAERMKLLVQDVLAYSTLQKEGFVAVNLNEIAAETLKDLEISIEEKNATINIPKLPTIDGNARQLKQVFENLISNSLKFSHPEVEPVVSIKATVEANNVLLTFSDNGIGFEDRYVDKMFDMFQRLHTRDKYFGTGMGLAICKKIIDMHGGVISAKGEDGKGAIFLVKLPLVQVEDRKKS